MRASRLALRLHRELGFRGYDEAAYRLGRHLHGYLADVTAAGEATPAEVRRRSRKTSLLPYGSELGVAVERGRRTTSSSRRGLRFEAPAVRRLSSGRPSPTPR